MALGAGMIILGYPSAGRMELRLKPSSRLILTFPCKKLTTVLAVTCQPTLMLRHQPPSRKRGRAFDPSKLAGAISFCLKQLARNQKAMSWPASVHDHYASLCQQVLLSLQKAIKPRKPFIRPDTWELVCHKKKQLRLDKCEVLRTLSKRIFFCGKSQLAVQAQVLPCLH